MMWLNGKLIETGAREAGASDDSSIDASSAGLTSGWGVFTTLGVRAGAPRFLARHVARLERDARAAQVPFDLSFGVIERAVDEILSASGVKNGLARLTLTRRGDGRWNEREGADLSILATETAPPPPSLRVILSPYRVEARRPLCGVKTTSYLSYLWAWREARARGFDEAILRDGREFLSESARASLFWKRGAALYTPALETGCLAGIGRELALEWAGESGLEVRQNCFEAQEAEGADEIWLVSAATGPRLIISWHDEDGAVRARFSALKAHAGTEFARWFEAQNE